MTVGPVAFGADVVSLQVGLIQLEDVLTHAHDAADFTVAVLNSAGAPVVITLRYTEAWAATSWRRQLECPRCSLPARVLQVVGSDAFCGRCLPRVTRHHTAKNTEAWRFEGAQFDRLKRALLRPGAPNPVVLRELAAELRHKTGRRARAVTSGARAAIRQTDRQVIKRAAQTPARAK